MRFGKLKMVMVAAALAGAVAVQAGESGRRECPGFGVQTQEQLDTWRANLEAKNASAPISSSPQAARHQPRTLFFTGKPYDADQDAYLFKYRAYDPNAARWTTSDPSGFPDGANSWVYCKNFAPSALDSYGLFLNGTDYTIPINNSNYSQTAMYDRAAFMAFDFVGDAICPLANIAINHAMGDTEQRNWTLNDNAALLFRTTHRYQTQVMSFLRHELNDIAQYHTGDYLLRDLIRMNDTFVRSEDRDAYYAFGGFRYSIGGTLHVNRNSDGNISNWVFGGVFSLHDTYTFGSYQNLEHVMNPTGIGYRLQSHGWIQSFETSGAWEILLAE